MPFPSWWRSRSSGLAKRVPAGVLDSGQASLATFLVGLYSVRYLTTSQLGVYSLFFSAFLLAVSVPTSLVFTTSRVQLLHLAEQERIAAFGQTLRAGLVPALASSGLVLLAIPGARSSVDASFLWPMAAATCAAAFLSPLQDHMRALLHLGHESWAAAAVSLVQLAAVAVVLGAAIAESANPAWAPFGALVVANALSLLVAMLLARRRSGGRSPLRLRLGSVTRSGSWLLAANMLNSGASFLALTIVIAVSDASVAGVAESARIVARPLSVAVLGLAAVILPQTMKAGRDGDEARGRRLDRYADQAVIGLTLLYLPVMGIDWPGNIMARLVPAAFDHPGLVLFTIGATAVGGMHFTQRSQILGARLERSLLSAEIIASVLYLAVSPLAIVIRAFAVPLGGLVVAVTRRITYRRVLDRHYRVLAAADTPGRRRREPVPDRPGGDEEQ